MSDYSQDWGRALARVEGCIAPNTVKGQFLRERVRELAEIHEAEVRSLNGTILLMLEDQKRDRQLYDRYVPIDANGEPIGCGDVVDVCGTVIVVAGVDACGGVFYLDDGGAWAYAHGKDCRVIDVALGDDPTALLSLREVARAIRDAWEDPDSDGNGEGMTQLIDRLCRIAFAAGKAPVS